MCTRTIANLKKRVALCLDQGGWHFEHKLSHPLPVPVPAAPAAAAPPPPAALAAPDIEDIIAE